MLPRALRRVSDDSCSWLTVFEALANMAAHAVCKNVLMYVRVHMRACVRNAVGMRVVRMSTPYVTTNLALRVDSLQLYRDVQSQCTRGTQSHSQHLQDHGRCPPIPTSRLSTSLQRIHPRKTRAISCKSRRHRPVQSKIRTTLRGGLAALL